MMELLLFVGLIVILVIILTKKKGPLEHIPGPKPYPLVGNILQLDYSKICMDLSELGQKYGGVFKLMMFSKPVVVVTDTDAIYEVLVKQSAKFAGRPTSFRIDYTVKEMVAITFVEAGIEHKSRRKAVHSFLKQFGSGIEKIEQVTHTATDNLLASISSENGKPMDIHKNIVNCIIDITAILLRGQTLSREEITFIKAIMDEGVEALGITFSGILLDLCPSVRFLGNKAYKQMLNSTQLKDDTLKEWMNDKPSEGYINFLQSMSKQEQEQSCLNTSKAQGNSIWEFFGAGVLTTSTTLTWLMSVMAHYPLVQEKMRKEVQTVIGPARYPTLKDQENLPYLRATLFELGRYASIAPFSIPHKTTQNVTLRGYDLPAETEVWVNLWALHHDEKLWNEAFTFKPERFLDADGHLVAADHPNRKNLMPFGAGQRVCVGEVFAMSRMFLITARILQHFTILPESSVEKQPSCDPRDMKVVTMIIPPPFKVRLINIDEA